MAATIQRNTLVAPFSFISPLTESAQGQGQGKSKPSSTLASTHQKWFTQAQEAINGSAQVTGTIPTSSSSPGQPGTIAFDSNFLYVCVGQNIWRRVGLSSF